MVAARLMGDGHWRNLLHIRRTPELLLDVTLSPIMFVLLFNFVFGGAIGRIVGAEA